MNAHSSNSAAWIMPVYIELHTWVYAYYDGEIPVSGDDAYRGVEVRLWPPNERMIGNNLRDL